MAFDDMNIESLSALGLPIARFKLRGSESPSKLFFW